MDSFDTQYEQLQNRVIFKFSGKKIKTEEESSFYTHKSDREFGEFTLDLETGIQEFLTKGDPEL